MSTVITEAGPCEVAGASVEGEQLWLQAADAERATGWSLKPEGLCQGDVCVPVPRAAAADYVRGGEVNMAAFWRLLERPVLRDHAGATWMLGAGATERAAALQSLTAPDFSLPDLSGQLHKLSDFRGKRVFLTTWSSW